jgi:NAD dependent epimerase/dehydratase family enzyme
LVDSRIKSTRSLVAAIREAEKRPLAVRSGSGIGYYGSYDDGPPLDESSPRATTSWRISA